MPSGLLGPTAPPERNSPFQTEIHLFKQKSTFSNRNSASKTNSPRALSKFSWKRLSGARDLRGKKEGSKGGSQLCCSRLEPRGFLASSGCVRVKELGVVATNESSAAVKAPLSRVFPGYSCASQAEAFSWHGTARGSGQRLFWNSHCLTTGAMDTD